MEVKAGFPLSQQPVDLLSKEHGVLLLLLVPLAHRRPCIIVRLESTVRQFFL
jgi:hypothetical protein